MTRVMRLKMQLPAPLSGELTLKDFTYKSYAFMFVHMLCVISFLIKTLSALVAVKGKIAGMKLHVSVQMRFIREAFWTLATCVHPGLVSILWKFLLRIQTVHSLQEKKIQSRYQMPNTDEHRAHNNVNQNNSNPKHKFMEHKFISPNINLLAKSPSH